MSEIQKRQNMCTDGGCGFCVHCVEYDNDCSYEHAKEILALEKRGTDYREAVKLVLGNRVPIYAGQTINVADVIEHAQKIGPDEYRVDFKVNPTPDRRAAVEATRRKKEQK